MRYDSFFAVENAHMMTLVSGGVIGGGLVVAGLMWLLHRFLTPPSAEEIAASARLARTVSAWSGGQCPCWYHSPESRHGLLAGFVLGALIGLVLGAVIGNPGLGLLTLVLIVYLCFHQRAWHCSRWSCTNRGWCRHV